MPRYTRSVLLTELAMSLSLLACGGGGGDGDGATATQSESAAAPTSASARAPALAEAPAPAVSAGVAYKGMSAAMWAEIASMRRQFGDPNDCKARVDAIPTTGTVVSPGNGSTISNALASSNTVILRGGTYAVSSTINLSGKRLIGAAGEDVVIDGSNVDIVLQSNSGGVLSNVRVLNAGDIGVNIYGNGNLMHRVSVGRSGLDSRNNSSGYGFAVHFGATNNCLVSTEAYDSYNESGAGCSVCSNGGNSDGYAMKFGAANNTLIDSHSYRNGDDGIDFWDGGAGYVYFSTAFDNGKVSGKAPGDGNGVKFGRGNVRHYVYKSEAYNNRTNGFDINGNTVQPLLVQSEAYGNGNQNYVGVSP